MFLDKASLNLDLSSLKYQLSFYLIVISILDQKLTDLLVVPLLYFLKFGFQKIKWELNFAFNGQLPLKLIGDLAIKRPEPGLFFWFLLNLLMFKNRTRNKSLRCSWECVQSSETCYYIHIRAKIIIWFKINLRIQFLFKRVVSPSDGVIYWLKIPKFK